MFSAHLGLLTQVAGISLMMREVSASLQGVRVMLRHAVLSLRRRSRKSNVRLENMANPARFENTKTIKLATAAFLQRQIGRLPFFFFPLRIAT